jgi:hypothetical protein
MVTAAGMATASASVTPRKSAIFAGYAVSNPGHSVRQVTATFVVPTITCENSFSGVGPSVLVYSKVNARTGSHLTSGAGVGVACEDGGPFYESVMIVNGHAFNDLELQAGDTVQVTVRVVPGSTRVSLVDVTTGVSKTRGGSGHNAVQAFIGDNSVVVDGQSGNLDPFTASEVSNVQINSRPLGSRDPFRFQWVKQGRTLVTASPLTSGEDFTLTFRSSG